MTLRHRLEALEGPKPSPVDEAAVDAEIRQLVGEIAARDGVAASVVLAQVDAEIRALAGRP